MSADQSPDHIAAVRPSTSNILARSAVAVGRLDGVAGLATSGLQRLLQLRCAVLPFGRGPDGMIAILRADREGDAELVLFDESLGGAIAAGSTATSSSGDALPAGAAAASAVTGASPGLLGALLAARERLRDGVPARDASLAFSRQLWGDGVLGGPWLALPFDDASAPEAYGDVQGWLEATCAAVEREASATVRGLERARARLAGDEAKVRALGRAAYSALDLFHLLAERLIVSIAEASAQLGQTVPTAGAAMERLVAAGAAREVTGRARDRRFAYRALVNGMAP